MSLFLNNGSQSNPSAVVLLTPGAMNEQLNRACQAFVDHTVKASLISITAAQIGGLFCTFVVTVTWYVVAGTKV